MKIYVGLIVFLLTSCTKEQITAYTPDLSNTSTHRFFVLIGQRKLTKKFRAIPAFSFENFFLVLVVVLYCC